MKTKSLKVLFMVFITSLVIGLSSTEGFCLDGDNWYRCDNCYSSNTTRTYLFTNNRLIASVNMGETGDYCPRHGSPELYYKQYYIDEDYYSIYCNDCNKTSTGIKFDSTGGVRDAYYYTCGCPGSAN